MDQAGVHELTAAYALDALDDHDEREYEEHLRRCPECREQLVSLQEAASMLAYGAEPVAPPPALREKILEGAASEQQNVVRLRPRWVFPGTAAAAAVAAAAAIGLGLWANALSNDLDRERTARDADARAVSVLADPQAQQVALRGASGRLVVSPSGTGVLVVSRLDPAPRGKDYEAWVFEGKAPKPAGLFDASEGRDVLVLTRPVRRGSQVAVTLEREGGVESPEGPAVFSART